jgi:hypothetical protein
MKKIEPPYETYIELSSRLWAMGWIPCGNLENKQMLFNRSGKIYDLSAADLTQLDRIEKEGLFIVA